MGGGKPLSCRKCGAIILPAYQSVSRGYCEYCSSVVQRYGGGGADQGGSSARRAARSSRAWIGWAIAAVVATAIAAVVAVRLGGGGGGEERAGTQVPVETYERGAPAEATDPGIREARDVPETPDPGDVSRRLAAIDVAHCPGDFAVRFGIEIQPDGAVRVTNVGALELRGGARLSCVSGALERVRFPPSRSGMTTEHELRGGALR